MVSKQSRRAKKSKQSRRAKQSRGRKQSRRNQRGGSCAARPLNRQSFQRGGMAPFDYKDGLLLDTATRHQAEVSGLDQYIADSQVLAKQHGGRRHKSKRHISRRRSSSRRRNSRKQRGGSNLAEFNASYELLPANVPRGANPQFETEGSVNALYHEAKGAQA